VHAHALQIHERSDKAIGLYAKQYMTDNTDYEFMGMITNETMLRETIRMSSPRMMGEVVSDQKGRRADKVKQIWPSSTPQ